MTDITEGWWADISPSPKDRLLFCHDTRPGLLYYKAEDCRDLVARANAELEVREQRIAELEERLRILTKPVVNVDLSDEPCELCMNDGCPECKADSSEKVER